MYFKPFGPVTHIYATLHWATNGSDNGLSPVQLQAIIWTNYLLIVNWALANISQWNLNKTKTIFNHKNQFDNVVCKITAILSRSQTCKFPCKFPCRCASFKCGTQRSIELTGGYCSNSTYTSSCGFRVSQTLRNCCTHFSPNSSIMLCFKLLGFLE